jgi:hypothetical protein
MKIAVASPDGFTVAGSLPQARCVLVFPVEGDRIGEAEQRLRPGYSLPAQMVPVACLQDSMAAPQSAEAFAAATLEDEQLGDELLREMLDCQVVLAGRVSSQQQRQLQRFGILSLPALPGERAEVAVRFVVSGNPPEEGEACGTCPNRMAAPAVPVALGFPPAVASPFRKS